MARRRDGTKYDRSSDLKARAEDDAEVNAVAAEAAALEAQGQLYDNYSLREVQNATALSGFRRRKTGKQINPSEKDLARLRAQAGAAEQRAEEARREAQRVQAAKTKATAAPIRQGVKAAVDTVPMPVRLEVEQVKALKLLAATEGTTASAIIRGAIRQVLIESADGNAAFAAALKAARITV
ncbi:ribbon-helix-helix protein, CopG family [Paraburkholderia caledonica]|uniref:ribbon-helix-helix protein, CopG family n=1 Tax=Paraburkholderia caledonica TaxID=134536 RepID=UPI000DEFB872|nr:hypothetical protein CUJ87_09345 [Paraburkholderia caledonica]